MAIGPAGGQAIRISTSLGFTSSRLGTEMVRTPFLKSARTPFSVGVLGQAEAALESTEAAFGEMRFDILDRRQRRTFTIQREHAVPDDNFHFGGVHPGQFGGEFIMGFSFGHVHWWNPALGFRGGAVTKKSIGQSEKPVGGDGIRTGSVIGIHGRMVGFRL